MSVLFRFPVFAVLLLAAVSGLSFTSGSQAQLVHDPSQPAYTQVAQRSSPKQWFSFNFDRRAVRYKTRENPGTIIIDTRKFKLYYVLGDGRAYRYGVGIGRQGFGWKGTVTVGRKAEWPGWTPPAAMRRREPWLPAYMEGGINNPLGARALYLYRGGRDTLYRIHGTNAPWTIGRNVSSGCIRLTNDDVKHLYKHVRVGAKVVVR